MSRLYRVWLKLDVRRIVYSKNSVFQGRKRRKWGGMSVYLDWTNAALVLF